jgi:hypothetical protein
MLIETTIEEAEVSLSSPPAVNGSHVVRFHAGWALGKLLLMGLVLMYFVGWIQDLQRIRGLEAEPTPPSKVITKYEAWERIYPRLPR